MRARLARLGRAVAGAFDLRDAFVFCGLGAIGAGLAQIYPPAAFVVVGAALFWLGVRR